MHKLQIVVNRFIFWVILGFFGILFFKDKFHFLALCFKAALVILNKIQICFAVYLLHVNPNVINWFCNQIRGFDAELNGLTFLLVMFVFLMGIFMFAILIDKIRIKIWNKYIVPLINSKKYTS